MKKMLLRLVLAAVLLGGGFVWGFFVHRDAIFPHSLLVRLGMATKILKPIDVKADGGGEDAALSGLSYVDGTFDEAADQSGVLLDRRKSPTTGLNFYGSRSSASCRLIDMTGKVVHEWSYPSGTWEHTELLPNGDVLASIQDNRLMRLDADSKVLWTTKGRFHHDLAVLGDGSILALTRAAAIVPEVHPTMPTLDDRLLHLSADGTPGREVSLTRLLLDSPYAFLVPSLGHRHPTRADGQDEDVELDVLHTNHVEVFDGALAEKSPLYAKGNVLVSIRNINTIAILDPALEKVLWIWGASNLSYQHDPVLLDDGHILLFDNGTKASRVLEVDPLTRQVVWKYEDGPRFFSATRGSVQRLPNGNTLVTESDRGYVFEVTPGGEVVWRFANPEILPGNVRAAVWRMTRFAPADLPFLNGAGGR